MRGTRLIKTKRIIGNRPLVTAGYENMGVAEFICNEEQNIFSAHSITIDMFGNCFYRNYEYSADDNILVLYNKLSMSNDSKLFIASVIHKSLSGKYSYAKQYRLTSFNETTIQLPVVTPNGEIDFAYMQTLISAVQKLVIKDVVLYADKKIEATKKVTRKN